MRDIKAITGKEYLSSITQTRYRIHGAHQGDLPWGLAVESCGDPFAYDDCGNAFTENEHREIGFWDHETGEVVVIADSWDNFVSGCAEPEPVDFKEAHLISAWVDPKFARQVGLDVPEDGWMKKEVP